MSPWLKGVQGLAWASFAAAWIHMGWVDWTQQKIRNRFLLVWFGVAVALYGVLLAQSTLGQYGRAGVYLNWAYYPDAGVYVGFSMAAAYLLWALNIWPAGDVKLFSLLALYYPLLGLPASFLSGIRFLEVLINVFVSAAAFLFVMAAIYLWRTRLTHQFQFLTELGMRRVFPFLKEKAFDLAAGLKLELRDWAATMRDPKALAVSIGSWLMMMALMSVVSYSMQDLIQSTVLKTLLCFGLFFGWSRVAQALGRPGAFALSLAILGALLARKGNVDWKLLAAVFGHISVFSFFLFFGIQTAARILAGHSVAAMLPIGFMIFGLIPFNRIYWFFKGLLPGMPDLGVYGATFAPLAGLGTWAGMGLFFGLALVFVRIWDSESYAMVRVDQIRPFATIAPPLLAKMAEDEEFYEEHFSRVYPDGLLPDQVEALKAWCKDNGVKEVPLAPTISFANWIFWGYFLTWAMDGHALKWIY